MNCNRPCDLPIVGVLCGANVSAAPPNPVTEARLRAEPAIMNAVARIRQDGLA